MTVKCVVITLGPATPRDADREEKTLTFDGVAQWRISSGSAYPREMKLMLAIREAIREYEGFRE